MEKFLDQFNKATSYTLLGIGMLFTAFQTIELVWEVFKGFYNRFRDAGLDYVPEYFKPVAILFFNILLFLEILETVKIFNRAHEVKIRVIIIVCLIAVSRKVLSMDAHKSDPLSDLSVAALILAFSVSYFLIRKNETETIDQTESQH